MLVLSVLASAEVTAVLVFVAYLFIGGYSGGSSPTSVAPVLFPIAILIFLAAGLPSMLICGLLWAGFALSSRRQDRANAPGAPPVE